MNVRSVLAPAFAVLALSTLVLAGCGSTGGTGTSPSASATAGPGAGVTKQDVVGLVDTTAAAIEQDAQGTFAAIDAGEAPYVDPSDPEVYAFVFDRTVTLVAHPDPALQGKSMRGVPDETGECIRDEMVCYAFADGSGWIDYVRAKPGGTELFNKASYYRLVTGSDGQDYVVGAGLYLDPWTGTPSPSPSAAAAAATRDEVKAFVDEAWSHVEQVGREQAVADFMDTSGPWVRGDLYVFAYDDAGTVLCLPFDAVRLGEDRWDARDTEGTYFIREMASAAKKGSGWVDYLYVNPAAGFALQPKSSYVRGVDDTWFIGAGTYPAQD